MLPILRSNRMCSGSDFPGVPGRLAPAWMRFLISLLGAICRSTPVVDTTPSVIRHVARCMLHVACRLIEICAESCCVLQAQLWLTNYVLTYARTKAHTSLKSTAARHAARTPIGGHCARTVLGPAGRVWITGMLGHSKPANPSRTQCTDPGLSLATPRTMDWHLLPSSELPLTDCLASRRRR